MHFLSTIVLVRCGKRQNQTARLRKQQAQGSTKKGSSKSVLISCSHISLAEKFISAFFGILHWAICEDIAVGIGGVRKEEKSGSKNK